MKLRILYLLFFSITIFAQEKQSFYFDFNKHEFNEEQKTQVFNWVELHPNIKIIKVEGFCDWVGNNPYNDKLSYSRIDEFLSIVNEKLMDSDNLITKGFGKKFEQNEVQDLNRRVDVYFVPIDYSESNEQDFKTNNLDSIVKQKKVGDKIKLKNLYFYNNSGVFVPKSKPVLAELLKVMRDNPTLKIEIHGHICCQPVRPNEQVSKIRALAVYNFLVNNKISRYRLSYKSFGSSQPIYKIPERNEDERNENRRVEILILEK